MKLLVEHTVSLQHEDGSRHVHRAGATLRIGRSNTDATLTRTIADRLIAQKILTPIAELEERLESLGGGWYRLPDGSKIRGADAAAEELVNLERGDDVL